MSTEYDSFIRVGSAMPLQSTMCCTCAVVGHIAGFLVWLLLARHPAEFTREVNIYSRVPHDDDLCITRSTVPTTLLPVAITQ
jgi:hypothetical protein